jgi:hypothetical protein
MCHIWGGWAHRPPSSPADGSSLLISLTDIEGAFFDIDKSSISGHVDIDVLTFDIMIDVSSI